MHLLSRYLCKRVDENSCPTLYILHKITLNTYGKIHSDDVILTWQESTEKWYNVYDYTNSVDIYFTILSLVAW